ncbi:sigma-70 family RNA polymerase sigma factor [Thalassospira povalilytica]|uniref:sigma-70 family RNA polymerase sigma factor n=1 Tax=Thalassospira povalilytica TaxID=732237 RepID=UPI001D180F2C|nr:sigma-70 family RNA polymerase sigma factor [Thalassospira povalilytica]MCC4238873.1 sigma-70 family RNA polymerase sigma factor [Thalassospira povalilytica]
MRALSRQQDHKFGNGTFGLETALRSELTGLLPRAMRFARSLTRDTVAAEDLVQTAYIKAVERIDQFEPGTRLDSWLYRIIQTSWIDEKRRDQRRGNVVSFEDARDTAMPKQKHGGTDRIFLQSAMASLVEDQRAAMTLVLIEGYSYREAADILGVPDGTVMSRVARARKTLAALHDDDSNLTNNDGIQRGSP